MQTKSGVVELIKRYQQLFTDLDHKQIAERLVKLIIAKPALNRAALIILRDNQLFVEAIGTQIDNVVSLDIRLKLIQQLPRDLIQSAFQTGHVCQFELDGEKELRNQEFETNSRAAWIQPVLENGKVIATFYLESHIGLNELSQCAFDLEPVWAFSVLLISHVIELWKYEEQAEKIQLTEQALWANEIYLNAILSHSPALISVKDLKGKVVLASDHYKQLMDVGDDGFVGKNVYDVYPVSLADAFARHDNALISGSSQTIESEFDAQHKDGTTHAYLMVKFPLRDKVGEIFGICTMCTDITERKQAENALKEQQIRLNYMAFHDSLTGLPNRSLFYDRISQGFARARRHQHQIVLMLLDLDRFKNINDSLGHDAGDLLLKAISRRLHESIRDMDTVARLGGDEFVVVLEGITRVEDVTPIANKILSTLSRPISIHGHELATTVSIGISVYPQDGETTEELLKNADIAMYKAKEQGKNNYQFYTEGMNASAVNYLLLENDLRRAIEQNQLVLHYQPQIDLKTTRLMGVEALVRWSHPSRGVVSPVHFITLAEETGLIIPLGEWVLRAACQQQKRWLKAGKYVGKVAVNLSARQFRQPRFIQRIADILKETELPAKYLELEITESSAMEHAGETITMLNLLNKMGLSLAIDDFGTGYSSLAYLKRFPIQKLKIDRSFISDIDSNQNDAAIAKSIIGLAHNMMLNVVAEGVEDGHQANWLRKEGCDQAQGFLYARPMSAEQLDQFFNGNRFSINNPLPLADATC